MRPERQQGRAPEGAAGSPKMAGLPVKTGQIQRASDVAGQLVAGEEIRAAGAGEDRAGGAHPDRCPWAARCVRRKVKETHGRIPDL